MQALAGRNRTLVLQLGGDTAVAVILSQCARDFEAHVASVVPKRGVGKG